MKNNRVIIVFKILLFHRSIDNMHNYIHGRVFHLKESRIRPFLLKNVECISEAKIM